MPGPIEVTGAAQLANLSRALRNAGQNELRKEWLRGIRKATAPAKERIPESARAKLPRRGGLNEYIATGLKVTPRTSLSGQQARVSIIATDPPHHDIKSMDAGRLRHPVYATGPRSGWHWAKKSQVIPPGFFTDACLSLAPAARREIAAGTNRVLAEIARSTL